MAKVWSYVGIPYITDGNLLSTGFAYDPTDDTTLAHPALPSPWTSEVPGFYYINRITGTGTPTWGDPTAPLNQIPRTIAAGSVIVMADAVYDFAHTSPNTITFSGTAGNQCWVIAEDPANPPICRKKWEVIGNHTIIEDIDCVSTAPVTDTNEMGMALNNATFITIRRCDWGGNFADGGWGIGGGCDHIYYYDNHIHDTGNPTPTFDDDEHGININGADDVWIINNHIHDCSGDSVQIGGQPGTGAAGTNRIYCAGNDCHDNRQTAIWVKEATDVIISTNESYNMFSGLFNAAVCFGAQDDHVNVWIINNTCHDSWGGIHFQSATGTQYIIGNLLYDLTGSPTFDVGNPHHPHAITARGGINQVINNTIQNCHAGISCTGTNLMVVENNLIGEPTVADASQIHFENTTNKTSNFNYYRDTTNVRHDGTVGTLTTFQSAGFEANAQNNADPLFTNEAGDDFTLVTGSVCIGTGKVADVYATFSARYGDSIAADIAGTSRPVGNWEIGAFEVSGVSEVSEKRISNHYTCDKRGYNKRRYNKRR